VYEDLVDAHRDEIKDAMVWNVDRGTALSFADLKSANTARARLAASLRDFFATHDVLVTPAVQVAPFDAGLEFPIEVAGVATPNYLDWLRAATTISATGLPCLSVPAGFTPEGLPGGLQPVTADGNGALLLRSAEGFARATGVAQRRPVICGLRRRGSALDSAGERSDQGQDHGDGQCDRRGDEGGED